MDATRTRQLAELHSWLSPLSLEIGPNNADGIAPRSNAKPLNDMLANVYGCSSSRRTTSRRRTATRCRRSCPWSPKAVGAGLDDFRAQLRADVVAVLGEDNAEQADEIVDKPAARLGTKPAVAQ
ncbi:MULTISPECIES: hypothetical protein [Amycolatopsis]|uniref:hypothetical protein n=1 Tax=Amycolatopsis TaxID=1813 RepID=UPI000AB69AFA|nr:hypothetical protein [Amycolatopsis nivea]